MVNQVHTTRLHETGSSILFGQNNGPNIWGKLCRLISLFLQTGSQQPSEQGVESTTKERVSDHQPESPPAAAKVLQVKEEEEQEEEIWAQEQGTGQCWESDALSCL